MYVGHQFPRAPISSNFCCSKGKVQLGTSRQRYQLSDISQHCIRKAKDTSKGILVTRVIYHAAL